MFPSMLIAFVVVLILGLLLARFAPRRHREGPLPARTMRRLTRELLRAMGMRVVAEDEEVLIATHGEPMGENRYVVILADGDVDQAGVLAAAEAIKSEGAVRGMLITSGAIETAGLASVEVGLTLVDGDGFRRLVAQYLPERLREVDRSPVPTSA